MMLGSSGGDSSLTKLADLVANPTKLKKAIADLKAATDTHHAARDEAIRHKREAAEALAKADERLAAVDQREQVLQAANIQLRDQQGVLQQQRARLERDQAEHAQLKRTAEQFHADRITADNRKLAAAKSEFEASKTVWLEVKATFMREAAARQTELDRRENRLATQTASLNGRETAIAKQEAALRERVRRVNEIFDA